MCVYLVITQVKYLDLFILIIDNEWHDFIVSKILTCNFEEKTHHLM